VVHKDAAAGGFWKLAAHADVLQQATIEAKDELFTQIFDTSSGCATLPGRGGKAIRVHPRPSAVENSAGGMGGEGVSDLQHLTP
jgi:hypothetical protein